MPLTGIGSRKRYRNVNDDELSEFTPLSKRINNLHLNNTIFPLPEHLLETTSNLETVESPSRSHSTVPATHSQESYNPELGPSQNQFYYESNRLLYELYLERSQRHGSLQTF